MDSSSADPLNARLIDSLYTDAMLLADEAKSYFEDAARRDRLRLDPLTRVGFSCESLKVTTRLMHIIAWLLTRRAIGAGEIAGGPFVAGGTGGLRRLGIATDSDDGLVERLPESARTLIAASRDLYARVARLEDSGRSEEGGASVPNPARALMMRLERSF